MKVNSIGSQNVLFESYLHNLQDKLKVYQKVTLKRYIKKILHYTLGTDRRCPLFLVKLPL